MTLPDDMMFALKQAEQGEPMAQCLVGTWYLGQKDYTSAAKWFEKAAEQNYAEAQMRLGLQYSTGQGVTENIVKGLEWISKAAEKGYARAQFHMGNFSEDITKSVEWYHKAAIQGDTDAVHELTILAEQGNTSAQKRLWAMYMNGIGVPKDEKEGQKWFEKAVENGDPDALFTLGRSWMQHGNDYKKAAEYFKKAEAQGHVEAKDYLVKCNFNINNGTLVKYRGTEKNVTIPSSITSIGPGAFEECKEIKEIIIPSSVTSIGDRAFYCCFRLNSITIPSNVTSIGERAFCLTDLSSITIPSSVISIGENAFSHCKELQDIIIPDSVQSIGKGAFDKCEKLNKTSESVIRKRFGGKPFGGCYIATAVYGSYDCPQVWTLRRYRDFKLANNVIGRFFINIYYAISPSVVKWFGKEKWFNNFWRFILDHKINILQKHGFENTPYKD